MAKKASRTKTTSDSEIGIVFSRVSPDELESYKAQAAEDGERSFSEWVRKTLNKVVKRRRQGSGSTGSPEIVSSK